MTTPSLHNTKFRCICRECGAEFGALRSHALYCSRACNRVFNNRRASRGAELYDFVMNMRIVSDRSGPEVKECRAIIEALAGGYRESDKRHRDGRRSWMTLDEAKLALNRLAGCSDGR